MEVSVPVSGGRGNRRGASPPARGCSDMNSIHPHEVRIQLIQLLNKVSSRSVRVPGVRLLSLAALLGTHPAPRPQEVSLAIRAKGAKLCL